MESDFKENELIPVFVTYKNVKYLNIFKVWGKTICSVENSLQHKSFINDLNEIEKEILKNGIELKFPKNMKYIAPRAFTSIKYLFYLEIPKHITNIESFGLGDIKSVKEIKLHDKLNSLNTALFFNNKNLEKIIVPNSVNIINAKVFDNNHKLEKLNILNPLCLIDPENFVNTPYEKIFNKFIYAYTDIETMSYNFIKFLNKINTNINSIDFYIKNEILSLEDVSFLIKYISKYNGYINGVNYGI